MLAEFGDVWDDDDLEGLRWRVQSVTKFRELRDAHNLESAEEGRMKREIAENRRLLALYRSRHQQELDLMRAACAQDPLMVSAMREIVEAHSDESGAVDGERPDFKALEARVDECGSGLTALREEMSKSYESEILDLKAQVGERDAQIKAQSREIEQKENAHQSEVSGLKSQVEERDAQIKAQSREIEQKEKVHESEISGLKAQVGERDVHIKAQSQTLEEKEKALQERDTMLEEMQKQITAKGRDISDRDMEIGRRTHEIGRLEAAERAAARERDHARASLRQETLGTNRLQRELDTVRAMYQSLHILAGELTGEVHALSVELEDLRGLD